MAVYRRRRHRRPPGSRPPREASARGSGQAARTLPRRCLAERSLRIISRAHSAAPVSHTRLGAHARTGSPGPRGGPSAPEPRSPSSGSRNGASLALAGDRGRTACRDRGINPGASAWAACGSSPGTGRVRGEAWRDDPVGTRTGTVLPEGQNPGEGKSQARPWRGSLATPGATADERTAQSGQCRAWNVPIRPAISSGAYQGIQCSASGRTWRSEAGDRRMEPLGVREREVLVATGPEDQGGGGDAWGIARGAAAMCPGSRAHLGDEGPHLGATEAVPEVGAGRTRGGRREGGRSAPPGGRPGKGDGGGSGGSSRNGGGRGSPRRSASSHWTSEFITTSRLIRSGMSRGEGQGRLSAHVQARQGTRSRPQASSSESRRSAMWNGVAPPGQASLSPMPGQSGAMTVCRSASRGASAHQIWRLSG